jgi:hypothetical protein
MHGCSPHSSSDSANSTLSFRASLTSFSIASPLSSNTFHGPNSPLATLIFSKDYESYIQHYPIAESRHRNEMQRNELYKNFIHQCYLDRRIRKRDLVTFISRPVTRLPRVSLLLEAINKNTDESHPDRKDLPLLLNVVKDLLKSTQRGIAAAESKVKFWEFCESLVYQKGEIIVRAATLGLKSSAPRSLCALPARTWICMTRVASLSTLAPWPGSKSLTPIRSVGLIYSSRSSTTSVSPETCRRKTFSIQASPCSHYDEGGEASSWIHEAPRRLPSAYA